MLALTAIESALGGILDVRPAMNSSSEMVAEVPFLCAHHVGLRPPKEVFREGRQHKQHQLCCRVPRTPFRCADLPCR